MLSYLAPSVCCLAMSTTVNVDLNVVEGLKESIAMFNQGRVAVYIAKHFTDLFQHSLLFFLFQCETVTKDWRLIMHLYNSAVAYCFIMSHTGPLPLYRQLLLWFCGAFIDVRHGHIGTTVDQNSVTRHNGYTAAGVLTCCPYYSIVHYIMLT